MMNVKRVISAIERDYIISNLRKDKRIDGRDLWEYRDIDINVDMVQSAEGSADVSLGETRIISGLSGRIGSWISNPGNKMGL